MDNFLTKDKVKVILQNTPKGTNQEDVVNALISRGYILEGLNDQPKPKPTMTGLDKATFQATGNEGIVGGALKAVGNVPSSGIELGKNVFQAVTKPVETAKSIGTLVKGVGAKIGEVALEKTDIGQSLLEKANQRRIEAGQPELERDEQGRLQATETQELQAINQVGQFIGDRYGSLDKLKETVIEDPVGVLADLATVFSGGAAVASKAGAVTKVSEFSNIGSKLQKASQIVEPTTAVSKAIGTASKAIGGTLPAQVAKQALPTVQGLREGQVAKALDLTPGDITNISKKTGNNITDFIVSKGLIKDTPEEIAISLNDFRKNAKTEKANVIAQVQNTYKQKQIPSFVKGLNTILKEVDGVAGLENVANEIKALKNKKTLTLEDVQNAQYIIDENSDIYSKIGDTKSSKTAKGLDNIRQDIRSFIEKEVDSATGGQVDIRQLNNEIQTSFSIEDAINTRATRNLTRQGISLGDMGVLFGGGATFSPAVGIGLYIGKKAIETPAFRLAMTRVLSKQPVKKLKAIVKEVRDNNVSKETQALLNKLADEAKQNLPIIESGSAIIDTSKSEQ